MNVEVVLIYLPHILIVLAIIAITILSAFIFLFRVWYSNRINYYNEYLRKKSLIEKRSKNWLQKRKEQRKPL